MSDRAAVMAAITEYANTPVTDPAELTADPSEVFSTSAVVELFEFVRTLGTQTEFHALVGDVAALIRSPDPFRASVIAIVCGTLVEHGADPGVVWPHLLATLPRNLALARAVLEREQPLDLDARFTQNPDGAKAVAGLTYLLLPTMAVLCRGAAFRQAARARAEIVEGIEALREHNREADFVAQVLGYTDGMEIVVLVPKEQKGFRVVLEAIASNAHLFTLLQAALIDGGHLPGEPVDPEVIAVACGETPHTRPLTDHARFHCAPFYSLDEDAAGIDGLIALPVEGTPAMIPALDDVPVILVGPKAFASRAWDSNFFANIHDALRSRVEIVEVLSPEQVQEWLARIRKAKE